MSAKLASNGLYHISQPAAHASFREKTSNRSAMPGIMSPSFFCRCCKQTKSTRGRKPILPGSNRAGYKCADCVEKASA